MVASARQKGNASGSFDGFIAAHPDLTDKELPHRYYSRERLESLAARTGWLDPDLRAIPGMADRPS